MESRRISLLQFRLADLLEAKIRGRTAGSCLGHRFHVADRLHLEAIIARCVEDVLHLAAVVNVRVIAPRDAIIAPDLVPRRNVRLETVLVSAIRSDVVFLS